MVNIDIPERLRRLEIPGRVTMLEGNGELTKLEVTSDHASAEIYLYGAQITDFRKQGEPPVLFTSQCSRFEVGQPIRGGIPLVFPWFGSREGERMHGFARISEWELHEAVALPPGGVTLRFSLPDTPEGATWPPFTANYVVTLTDRLTVELIITNASPKDDFTFENCFHTYFAVEDIEAVSVVGLKDLTYQDKLDNYTRKTETAEPLQIRGEVDRIYEDTPGPVEILDAKLGRRIRIDKEGSLSTVVWHPWSTRSQKIPDLGNEEYRNLLCVESGNVRKNAITLPPGQSSVTRMTLSTAPL